MCSLRGRTEHPCYTPPSFAREMAIACEYGQMSRLPVRLLIGCGEPYPGRCRLSSRTTYDQCFGRTVKAELVFETKAVRMALNGEEQERGAKKEGRKTEGTYTHPDRTSVRKYPQRPGPVQPHSTPRMWFGRGGERVPITLLPSSLLLMPRLLVRDGASGTLRRLGPLALVNHPMVVWRTGFEIVDPYRHRPHPKWMPTTTP